MKTKLDQKHDNSAIADNVMQKIHRGEIRMRPRSYYTFVTILSAISSLLLGLALTYAISLVVWWARISYASGPAYGARRNAAELVESFPWWAFVAATILMIVLVYVIRHIGTFYKIRWQSILIGIVLVSILLGSVLSYMSFPSREPKQNSPQYGTLNLSHFNRQ